MPECGLQSMEGDHLTVVDSSSRSKDYFQRRGSRERKLFMSSRVADTLVDGASQRSFSIGKDDKRLQEEEFRSIYKEVQRLGMSQMSWKEKKSIEARQAVSLGAKPEKAHKMPIAMGMNIKRKREKMEAAKVQEDIALGFRPTKREKRMSKKPNAMDRGLRASEGVFKGGVLHVKPLAVQEGQSDKHSNAPLGKSRKKSHKKGKKGKFKGKKKRRQ